jgi:hypothetical protein
MSNNFYVFIINQLLADRPCKPTMVTVCKYHTCTVYGSHLSTVVNIPAQYMVYTYIMHTESCTYKLVVSIYGNYLSTVVTAYSNTCLLKSLYTAATCLQWSTYLHSIWEPPVHSGQHTCTVYGSHLSTVVNIPAQYMAATCPQWSTYLYNIWQPPQYMAATCPQWSTYLHTVYRILPNPNDNIQTHNPKAASILGNYPNLRGTGQNQ